MRLWKYIRHQRQILSLLLLLLPTTAFAQRIHHEEHESRHEVAIFMGVTTEAEHDESFFTIGGEYEFRFLPRLGISVELEYINGLDAGVFAFPVVFHVHKGLMVVAGPGWETSPREIEALGDKSDFLFRLGAQYSFHVGGRFSLMPAVDFDFVKLEHETQKLLVFGVKFAWGL